MVWRKSDKAEEWETLVVFHLKQFVILFTSSFSFLLSFFFNFPSGFDLVMETETIGTCIVSIPQRSSFPKWILIKILCVTNVGLSFCGSHALTVSKMITFFRLCIYSSDILGHMVKPDPLLAVFRKVILKGLHSAVARFVNLLASWTGNRHSPPILLCW